MDSKLFNSARAALAGAALASSFLMPSASAAPKLPNVVLIVTDDQGFGDIGCFGAKDIATPNLDRLALTGRRFTNFHASQPICTASRAGLLTGCYPTRIGFKGALGPHSNIGIADTELTLPEMFKSKGYATGMIGKWHLGDAPQFLPTHRGFDSYYGIPYSHDMWPRHPEFPASYPPLPLIEGDKVVNPDLQPTDLVHLTTDYTTRAVDFIHQNKDKPFFLYLAHNLPHVPLFVSDKFKGKSKRGLYGDVIEEIDWSMGEIEKELRREHLDQNTLVIFTSDNGPWLSYGDHAGSAGTLREGKHTNWEGGTRVPCIMNWPGQIPASTVSNGMMVSIDLLPTLAKKLAAPIPKQVIDGQDVWPLIAGEKNATNPHEAYFFYYGDNQLQAVISGDGHWKLQLPHTYVTLAGRPGGTNGIPAKYENRTLEKPELYDLVKDKEEKHDLADQQPAALKMMLDFAEKARAELGDSLTQRVGAGVRPAGQVQKAANPQIVGKSLTISCDVRTESLNGVIVAQGGKQNGYAIYLQGGKLIFGVRQGGKLFTAVAAETIKGKFSIEAKLTANGGMSLTVNGAVAATGQAPGAFKVQPNDPFEIGQDEITTVGDYEKPFALKGEVEKVQVTAD